MIYVITQFACIIALIINADFSQLNYFSWGLLTAGWIIGYLAVFNMQLDNLNIQPQLKTNHKLRTNGVYHWIRHPMYTSLILQCLALALTNSFSVLQWCIYCGLIITLFLKSNKEEMYLSKRFKEYAQYQKCTGRFLPKISGSHGQI